MPALLHNPQPYSDPLSGLTETGQAPTMRWCAGTRPPGGSSRQLRNVRIEIRQGLQLEGEFQPSSALSSACLVFASQWSLSASAAIPAWCFHIVLAQGRRGHGGCDIRAWREINRKHRPQLRWKFKLLWSGAGKTSQMNRVFVKSKCAYYDVIQSHWVELSSPVLILNTPSLYFKLCERHLENKMSKMKVLMLLIKGWRQMGRRSHVSRRLPSSEQSRSAAVRQEPSRGHYWTKRDAAWSCAHKQQY